MVLEFLVKAILAEAIQMLVAMELAVVVVLEMLARAEEPQEDFLRT